MYNPLRMALQVEKQDPLSLRDLSFWSRFGLVGSKQLRSSHTTWMIVLNPAHDVRTLGVWPTTNHNQREKQKNQKKST